jgi:hypothetical protein
MRMFQDVILILYKLIHYALKRAKDLQSTYFLKPNLPEVWVIFVLSLHRMLCVFTMRVITNYFRTN